MSNSLRGSIKPPKDRSSDRKTERLDLDKDELAAQFPRSSSSNPIQAFKSPGKHKDRPQDASRADAADASMNENLDYTRSERIHPKPKKKLASREPGSSSFAKTGFRVRSAESRATSSAATPRRRCWQASHC